MRARLVVMGDQMDLARQTPRRVVRLIASALAIGFVVSALVHTQGLQVLDTRLPRLPDGKPNLTAPAPKSSDGKPDLSGIWRSANDRYRRNLAADGTQMSFQPWAAALFKERQGRQGISHPSERCLPRGVPAAMLVRDYPWKIVQTPGVVLILFDESLHYRQILTDGRGFPEDPSSTWLGYSIGKWEGDTLVAETIGLNEETWLDELGHPHSDAMHVIERFRRRTVGTMDIEITIDDPKAYTKPWTATVRFELLPDTDLDEHVCAVQPKP
jgi:hypothetical protein